MAGLGKEAAKQIADMLRREKGRIRNTRQHRGRWHPRGGEGNVILKHAIIREICSPDCMTYKVEIIRRSFDESCGTGTNTSTGS